MKIVKVEDLHADAGWRTLSFLKLTTDEGLVGWAECHEGMGGPAMIQAIRRMAQGVIGMDPREVGPIGARLYLMNQMTQGGMIAQCIAAIENACLDLKGKAAGLPVWALYGGAHRRRLPAYWSHCGALRTRAGGLFPPVRSLDDLVALGREARERGYRALKTNLVLFDRDQPRQWRPAFGGGEGSPELSVTPQLLAAARDQMAAFRQGGGPDMEIMLDLNTHFRPEGLRRMARALEPLDLAWLEADIDSAEALAALRAATTIPVASLELVYGRRRIRPFLEAQAVDVCIVDPLWNGFPESMKIAQLAEAYEVNVAAHNAHGWHATVMGAHLCAAIPNFRWMEYDVDEVPWMSELFTQGIEVVDGEMILPEGPGWGLDVVEEAVLAHPPKNAQGRPWLLDWHRERGAA